MDGLTPVLMSISRDAGTLCAQFEDMRPDETYRQFTRRLQQQTRKVLREQDMEEKKGISQARKQYASDRSTRECGKTVDAVTTGS